MRHGDALAAPVDFEALFAALPTPYVVLTPDLMVREANEAYLATTGRTREALLGRFLFEAFPPPPESLDEHGVSPIQVAMERVRDTGRPETIPLQRYAIADAAGHLVERHWLVIGAPVLDERGRTRLIVQRAEDVSELVRERGRLDDQQGELWRRRLEEIEADLFTHAQQLNAALEAQDAAARRAASLADMALALTNAETVEDVERIVVRQGVAVLGADGGAVISHDEDGGWRITVDVALGQHVQLSYGNVPYDSPLPGCWSARTGQRLALPTRASGIAFHEVMTSIYADTRRDGWAFVPLTVGQERLGSLAVSWAQERQFRADELDLLDAFGAQCAQALHRIRAAETRRAAAASVQQLAEALQQALLTPPPEPDHLHLVVRYLPAGQQAQVGGDWYDAFMQPNGATMLVIGDVVGHDRLAAARMGQLRGLLRALAYADDDDGALEGPAAVLHRVEHAARGLEVDTLATAILARIERSDGDSSGSRLLRWSNAGHPPPVLLLANGSSRLLDREPDLLLGVDPDAERRDHTTSLPDGSTLVLFTDGLIERPDISLDDGFSGLQAALADLAEAPLDELCDTLLARLAPTAGQDDIALLAVRAYPEDRPRPASAGPNRTPYGGSGPSGS